MIPPRARQQLDGGEEVAIGDMHGEADRIVAARDASVANPQAPARVDAERVDATGLVRARTGKLATADALQPVAEEPLLQRQGARFIERGLEGEIRLTPAVATLGVPPYTLFAHRELSSLRFERSLA
jgi:hypothetical protein